MSVTSCPRAISAAATALSRRQLPQYIDAAPAVTDKMRITAIVQDAEGAEDAETQSAEDLEAAATDISPLGSASLCSLCVLFYSAALWNALARKRNSTMFPSCGCSQFNWIVGTGPRFKRSMCTASTSDLRNAGSQVIAL